MSDAEQTYTVTFVYDAQTGWSPVIDDTMPDSLAAKLIINIRDLTPNEIARGQAIAAMFTDERLNELKDVNLIWAEVQAEQERQRIARLFEI